MGSSINNTDMEGERIDVKSTLLQLDTYICKSAIEKSKMNKTEMHIVYG